APRARRAGPEARRGTARALRGSPPGSRGRRGPPPGSGTRPSRARSPTAPRRAAPGASRASSPGGAGGRAPAGPARRSRARAGAPRPSRPAAEGPARPPGAPRCAAPSAPRARRPSHAQRRERRLDPRAVRLEPRRQLQRGPERLRILVHGETGAVRRDLEGEPVRGGEVDASEVRAVADLRHRHPETRQVLAPLGLLFLVPGAERDVVRLSRAPACPVRRALPVE